MLTMFLRSAATRMLSTIRLSLLAGALGTSAALAQTSVPFSEVHTIAAPTTGVPQEFTFSVSTPGDYTVTLTDLGAALNPAAPLASVEVAASKGPALVGAPLVGAGALTLSSLAAGSYVLHVIGTPGNVPGSGPFGILVTDSANTQIATFQGTLALPSQALPNGVAVLDDSFTVASGSGGPCTPPQTGACFTVSLNDLQLPQALSSVTLLLIAQGGTTPVATLPNAGVYQATVPLTAGTTYRIFAAGQADSTANAGLYSAVVAPAGGGAPVYGRSIPVGNTVRVGSPAASAGNGSLVLTDLKYPAALTAVGAVATLTGQVVAQLNATGSKPFTATAGTYDVFAVAAPAAAAPGAGSYAVELAPSSGTPWLSVARGVTATGSALSAFSFDGTVTSAGNYTVTLTDFRFPAPLASAALAVAQKGALLGTPLSNSGSLGVSTATGPFSAIVFAQAAVGGGLFGVAAASGTATPVLDATQAVGAIFKAEQISITAPGSYSVTATDLGFPGIFANYDTIVTQRTSMLVQFFGGGTYNFQATPGTYWINFLAQPAAPAEAGTYALLVGTAPPPPVVNLSTDHSQVSSGSTVDIIWTTQNATSCSASGGWTGTQPTSGTVTSVPLTANTPFTLTCTGSGGSTSKTVTVTVSAPSSGGGGGGAISPTLLSALLVLLVMHTQRVMRASRPAPRVQSPRN
jgi:hypothetical protein